MCVLFGRVKEYCKGGCCLNHASVIVALYVHVFIRVYTFFCVYVRGVNACEEVCMCVWVSIVSYICL